MRHHVAHAVAQSSRLPGGPEAVGENRQVTLLMISCSPQLTHIRYHTSTQDWDPQAVIKYVECAADSVWTPTDQLWLRDNASPKGKDTCQTTVWLATIHRWHTMNHSHR